MSLSSITLLASFLLLFCIWGISMPTVSNGSSTNAVLEGRWWRTFSSNLTSLSSGSPTYLHPATASFSAIDLSITHPALYLDFCWQTDSDLHGSDHYPIVITTDTPHHLFLNLLVSSIKLTGQHSHIKQLWNSALTISAVQRILFNNLRMLSST